MRIFTLPVSSIWQERAISSSQYDSRVHHPSLCPTPFCYLQHPLHEYAPRPVLEPLPGRRTPQALLFLCGILQSQGLSHQVTDLANEA